MNRALFKLTTADPTGILSGIPTFALFHLDPPLVRARVGFPLAR